MAKLATLAMSTFAFFALPFLASASGASISVEVLGNEHVYHNDYDIVALDFTLHPLDSTNLQTVAIQASGTARYGIEYTSVKLFADRGEPGFQGSGWDELISTANQNGDSFLFAGLDKAIDHEQRFFIVISSGALLEEKSLQLGFQDIDTDNDNQWDQGDRGVFLKNGEPITYQGFSSLKIIEFKSDKVDQKAPKGSFIGLEYGTTNYLYGFDAHSIIFKGTAQDRNGGKVTKAEILIDGNRIIAENTGVDFGSWKAAYQPDADILETTAQLYLEDGAGFSWTSPAVDLFIDKRLVSAGQSSISAPENPILTDETITITAIIRDSQGSVLPNRPISFRITSIGGIVTDAPAILTDENGRVSLNTMSAVEGIKTVEFLYEGEVILSHQIEIVAPAQDPFLVAGDLIKGPDTPAVYYYGEDGERHVFLNQDVYESWYGNDFTSVIGISAAELAAIRLGDPVTFHPGTMLTAPSVNEVYLVTPGATLRHVSSEAVARSLFGENWNTKIFDLQESLLFAYTIGSPINSPGEINLEAMTADIDTELNG